MSERKPGTCDHFLFDSLQSSAYNDLTMTSLVHIWPSPVARPIVAMTRYCASTYGGGMRVSRGVQVSRVVRRAAAGGLIETSRDEKHPSHVGQGEWLSCVSLTNRGLFEGRGMQRALPAG